jgi:NADPH:quinone reductase-like Zn-dependent oxidoreductase
MKAVVYTEYGGPEVLHVRDVAIPTPAAAQILVDVVAASVNAVDCTVRRGAGPYQATFPHIPGRDFSGVVRSLAAGVGEFKVGDEVFGVLDLGVEGTYAEVVATSASLVARKPSWLSHPEATAVALTGLTAIHAIENTAKLLPGEAILIHGGAGGVAGFAIQLARSVGATVTTTASAENQNYVRELGAGVAIDYNNEDFSKSSDRYDVVFDTVGGSVLVRSYSVLKSGGRLVWIAPGPDDVDPPRSDVEVKRPIVLRSREYLERIISLLQIGAVVPPPIQRFKMHDVARAHAVSESRHLRGKLVIDVRETNP